MVGTFGIVNLTRDSFSDGGRFLDPANALEHARRLRADGATVLDLGAESTHPDAEDVPDAEQIARLEPVVRPLLREGAVVSIDTCSASVMRTMLALGVQWLNDVNGFRGEGALDAAAGAPAGVRFVVMFSRSRGPRADRPEDPAALLDEIAAFFAERLARFRAAGIAAERLVFDPGMGFFLGRTAAPSLLVLRHLDRLRGAGVPLLVSVSRKSVVGEVTGRPVDRRGPGTLAAELWAARAGVSWIRTHDVAAFRDAWAVESAIGAAE
jgi:dihydropteroate synthase type 2